MNKLDFMGLWDVYSGILTPTQQEITDAYFNLDLTPSEIAEQKGISRQAVSECLKTCKKQLEEYEKKLHVKKGMDEYSLCVSFMMTDVSVWAEKFLQNHPEYAQDINELNGYLHHDYSQEVTAALNKNKV